MNSSNIEPNDCITSVSKINKVPCCDWHLLSEQFELEGAQGGLAGRSFVGHLFGARCGPLFVITEIW
jgi:hypothetical protein